jgi:hypothetical protein
VWGAINVTLRGPETPGDRDAPAPPEPAVATGPVGVAAVPRWGGAVREQTAPQPQPEAGAARLGTWAPLPAPVTAEPALAPAVRAPASPPTLTADPLPEPGRVLPERAAAPIERTVTRRLAPAGAPDVTALPAAPSAPILSRLPELSAPAAAPLMAPRLAPPPPAAPVAALPASEPATLPLAVAAPPAAALKNLLAAPPPVAALPPVAPAPAPAALATPLLSPAFGALNPVTAGPPSVGPPSAGPPAVGAPPAAADAGTRLGHDVAGAPALPASAPPRLNLQLARPRGGELSRGLGGGVLAVLPRPPEVDTKLGQEIAKTAKPDCREAYAGAGLLAVVPLAVEALRKDSSCKW